jgi:DNA polymerase III epsilon subunit-like protein
MDLKLNLPYSVVAFDTETGGLNSDYDINWSLDRSNIELGSTINGQVSKLPAPILEIGALILSPKNLDEVSYFHSLCGPEKTETFESFMSKCTDKALEINGFKDRLEELKAAPPTSEVLKKFIAWLPRSGTSYPKYIPCGQNVRFDIEMINGSCKRLGIDFEIRTPPLELTAFSQLYFALPDRETVANYKLTTVASALGIPTKDAHTALADVRMTAACMKKMFFRFSTV